jgi:2,3-bisphosphoglycerate-dependent phosphoglycerate mutase
MVLRVAMIWRSRACRNAERDERSEYVAPKEPYPHFDREIRESKQPEFQNQGLILWSTRVANPVDDAAHEPLPYPFIVVELILVRHGLPVRKENTDGPADPELSIDGHAQAALFAAYMMSENIDAIYSSPLRRAVQTAEPLAAAIGFEPILVPGIAEWDQHSNEYIPVEELKAANDPRWLEMAKGGFSSDEIPEDFHNRVLESIEDIIDKHKGDTVVVTCHGGVINDYLSHILGIANSQFFYPNYTSIHRIAASSSGHRSVLSINESSHLRGSGLPTGLFHA